jgi:hypothetical protein
MRQLLIVVELNMALVHLQCMLILHGVSITLSSEGDLKLAALISDDIHISGMIS